MAQKQEKQERRQQQQPRTPRAMQPFENVEHPYEYFFPHGFMRPCFRWDRPFETMPAASARARRSG